MSHTYGVSIPRFPFLRGRMAAMAGRPRKDPSGKPLVTLSLSPTEALKTTIQSAAKARGMHVVDYLGALVANDLGQPIPGVPPLKEVLALRDSA